MKEYGGEKRSREYSLVLNLEETSIEKISKKFVLSSSIFYIINTHIEDLFVFRTKFIFIFYKLRKLLEIAEKCQNSNRMKH